jgi:hypothetical protein
MSNYYTIVIQDQLGNVGKTKVPLASTIFSPSATIPASIKTAVKNVTGGVVIRSELSTFLGEQSGQTPPTSNTPTVQDKVVMTMRGSDNSTQNLKIPGPISTIYESDEQTVDLGNTTVDAWAFVMEEYAVSEFNKDLTLVSGLRVGTRKLLKE